MNKKAILLTIKIAMFSVIFILCAILLHAGEQRLSQKLSPDISTAVGEGRGIVIIDAGHGGEDGGAVGINGALEKDINLKISMMVYDLLQLSDIPVIVTRDSDILLYSEGVSGKKKMQDLKNRLATAEKYEDSVFVSIHMNSYISSKYSGTQVYYSPNDKRSALLADTIQSYVKRILQPQNNRQTKPATSAIYILHNVKTPAVLIECGFLSNAKEAELLTTDSYQHKMASVIYSSIADYLNSQSKEKEEQNERL